MTTAPINLEQPAVLTAFRHLRYSLGEAEFFRAHNSGSALHSTLVKTCATLVEPTRERRGGLPLIEVRRLLLRYFSRSKTTSVLRRLVTESARALWIIETGQCTVAPTSTATNCYQRWFVSSHNPFADNPRHTLVQLHVCASERTSAVLAAAVSSTRMHEAGRYLPVYPSRLAVDARGGRARYNASSDVSARFAGWRVGPYFRFRDNGVANSNEDAWSRQLDLFMVERAALLESFHPPTAVDAALSALDKTGFGRGGHTFHVNETMCWMIAHNVACAAQSVVMAGLACPAFLDHAIPQANHAPSWVEP